MASSECARADNPEPSATPSPLPQNHATPHTPHPTHPGTPPSPRPQTMQLKEITHSRLAMLAFSGMVTQAVLTEKGFPYY